MEQREVRNLKHGLYMIHWRDGSGGGSSLATIGSTHNGEKWIAAANWTYNQKDPHASCASHREWEDVESVDPILLQEEKNTFGSYYSYGPIIVDDLKGDLAALSLGLYLGVSKETGDVHSFGITKTKEGRLFVSFTSDNAISVVNGRPKFYHLNVIYNYEEIYPIVFYRDIKDVEGTIKKRLAISNFLSFARNESGKGVFKNDPVEPIVFDRIKLNGSDEVIERSKESFTAYRQIEKDLKNSIVDKFALEISKILVADGQMTFKDVANKAYEVAEELYKARSNSITNSEFKESADSHKYFYSLYATPFPNMFPSLPPIPVNKIPSSIDQIDNIIQDIMEGIKRCDKDSTQKLLNPFKHLQLKLSTEGAKNLRITHDIPKEYHIVITVNSFDQLVIANGALSHVSGDHKVEGRVVIGDISDNLDTVLVIMNDKL